MMSNHPEIAYKLWVEHARDSQKVAQLLRVGSANPDDVWDALPTITKKDVDRWALERNWSERLFRDAHDMAPDQFIATKFIFQRAQEPAAQFMRDVLDGKLDNLDPRILRERIKVAMHMTNVAGHTPAVLMDVTKPHQGPKKDHSQEIAGLSMTELRNRAMGAHCDSVGVTIKPILATNDDDASVIDVVSHDRGNDPQPARPSSGGSSG